MTYALDTNTVIYLLDGRPNCISNKDRAVSSGDKLILPPIVDYEMWRGIVYKPSRHKEQQYAALVRLCGIGEITAPCWRLAANIYADLRRKSFTVGDADILIAAFCMENSYTLVTSNTKDFENVDGLMSVDWSDASLI